MPIQYTNRKGTIFHLCQAVTTNGKPRYYFAREPKGEPLALIPVGYRITESVNGVVSLSKDIPTLVLPAELRAVQSAVLLRFTLVNQQTRMYRLDRMGYTGKGGWRCLFPDDRIEEQAERIIPRLGTESYFDIY